MITLAAYFVVFALSDYLVFRTQPTGASLWLLSALPVFPMLYVIALIGRYLREERDEFKRDLCVRCLLWGAAGAMAVDLLSGFLHIFGWKGQLVPFSELFVFAALMLAAKLTYRISHRVPANE